jgi:hypothetical protein
MKFNKITIITLVCVLGVSIGILNVRAEENSLIKPGLDTKPGLKARVEAKFENNKDIRNLRASTTERIKELKDAKKENRQEIKDLRASSTLMFKEMKDKKREIVKQMELRTFEIRKDALVKELTVALKNLDNIKVRIDERIVKSEQAGRNMTKAKAELVIALEKLAKAKTAVASLASFTYGTSTTNTTLSTTTATSTRKIELEKPRKVGDEAIKAVKEARDSMKKVVEFIAKDMGKKIGNNTATTTATTTTSTTTSI